MPTPDPTQNPGFKRRVLAARLVESVEAAWPALWPALAVSGLFVAVSLFGLWLAGRLLGPWPHSRRRSRCSSMEVSSSL